MPSSALEQLTRRLEDIDQLWQAHEAATGTERGRRWNVVALHRAGIVLLSSHLEGFLEDLMRDALRAVEPGLDHAHVVYGFANPTPDKIDNLFSVLGMRKPCNRVSWRGASSDSVKRNRKSLVVTRNRIAHGTRARVTKDDVDRYRRYVEGFAQRFDALVRDRVRRLTGASPW
jgi:hypothetical protein